MCCLYYAGPPSFEVQRENRDGYSRGMNLPNDFLQISQPSATHNMGNLPAAYRTAEAAHFNSPSDLATSYITAWSLDIAHIMKFVVGYCVPNSAFCFIPHEPQYQPAPKAMSTSAPTAINYSRGQNFIQPQHHHQQQIPHPQTTSVSVYDTPTLQQLECLQTPSGHIRIIRIVMDEYYPLGINLLLDKNGDITDEIETKHKFDKKRTTFAILKRWLQGTGIKPQIWATLIEVLRQMQFECLANRINCNLSRQWTGSKYNAF